MFDTNLRFLIIISLQFMQILSEPNVFRIIDSSIDFNEDIEVENDLLIGTFDSNSVLLLT